MKGTDGPAIYIHNGKVYRLRIQSKADHASGNRMITAWTSAVGERGETEFKFWVAPDDPTALPVKIEFRARSFLKLTLKAGQSARARVLQPLLKSSQAA